MPAASNLTTAEWRKTWGEVFFSRRVGQDTAAMVVYLVRRRSRASRVNGLPRW
jgi:hypothetical protein